jgi:predicted  nucleic acid-binding Zn-ribbon protein
MATSEDAKKEIEAILAVRTATLAGIHNKAVQIDNRVEEITDGAVGRELTSAEQAELKELDSLMDELSKAQKRVIIVTHLKLANSTAVQKLKADVESTNVSLKSKFAKVKKVSESIKKIGAVVASLEKLVAGLGKLAAFL